MACLPSESQYPYGPNDRVPVIDDVPGRYKAKK